MKDQYFRALFVIQIIILLFKCTIIIDLQKWKRRSKSDGKLIRTIRKIA